MNTRHFILLTVLGASCILGAGCEVGNTVSPVMTPYLFVTGDRELSVYHSQVYGSPLVAGNPNKVSAHFSAPRGSTICFEGSLQHQIGAVEPANLMFGPGVYPFVLREGPSSPASLCGAMMVVNVDETVGLATFGKSAETKLFSDDLIAKARSGVLAKAVQKFDEKPVIYYWLGNRSQLPAPGNPSVELDFSGTQRLASVWVNGVQIPGHTATVAVRSVTYREVYAGGDLLFGSVKYVPQVKKRVHKLEIHLAGGVKYVGYIRNLEANAVTTFMRVPCRIPDSLFAAADRGTIAKYSVTAGEGAGKQSVAEIVFGRSNQ